MIEERRQDDARIAQVEIAVAELHVKVDSLKENLDGIHKRVFNGMSKELRQELAEEMEKHRTTVSDEMKRTRDEISSLRIWLFGALLTFLVIAAGIFVSGRLEVNGEYKAILDIAEKLDLHVKTTAPAGGQ